MIKYYIQRTGSHPVCKIFISCLTCSIFLCLFLISSHSHIAAQVPPPAVTTTAVVTVSADIGEPVLRLWGYGQPDSRIEVSGDRVADFTYSTNSGYFEFDKVYLPTPNSEYYPELCLTGIDADGRATPPTCIPALPANGMSYNVGPVILPPTLSLDEGVAAPSTQVGAGGITIPNSEVKIVLAEDSKASVGLTIVGTAYAYFIPNYTVMSDAHGYFSFNMPNTDPNNWRIFAVTNYSQGATSPKSNTLKFEVTSSAAITIGSIRKLFTSLLTLPVLIILEVILLLLVTTAVLLSKKKRKAKVYLNITDPVREYQNYLNRKKL